MHLEHISIFSPMQFTDVAIITMWNDTLRGLETAFSLT